jgi:hypothetical protein
METDDGDARVSVSSDAPDSNREFLYAPHVPGGGGGSGGYLDYTFRRAAFALFGVTVSGPLPFKTPRAKNPDLREVTLEVGGKTVLRFATAYGFRNIQNVVRKCKASSNNSKSGGVSSLDASAKTSSYDFVEIMACPSGCLNGGGQLPPPPAFEPGFRLSADAPLPQSIGVGHTAKQLLDDLEELYHTGSIAGLAYDGKSGVVARDPSANGDAARLYREFVGGDVGSAPAKALWHTRYHDRSAEAAVAAGGSAAAAANLKISSDW